MICPTYLISVLYCHISRWPLHYACRTGNYKQVKYLIDTLGFDYDKINEADDHNATPLYHAALTGHTDICCFLLQRGAICTENDSARVFYVALTPSLRTILREWSLSAASVDPYIQSLQQNFTINNHRCSSNTTTVIEPTPIMETADCSIHIWLQNKNSSNKLKFRSVAVHRIMLHFRCTYLFVNIMNNDEQNEGGCDTNIINIFGYDNVHCDALYRLIEYLYTGKVEALTFDMALLMLETAKIWSLNELYTKLQAIVDQYLLQIEQAKGSGINDVDDDLQNITTNSNRELKSTWSRTQHAANPVVLASLLGNTPSTSLTETFDDNAVVFRKSTVSDVQKLRSDMQRLALFVSSSYLDNDSIHPDTVIACSDITVHCHNEFYHLHKFRLMQHSEYFQCALKGNFVEALTSTIDLSFMISIDSKDALPPIIQWIYADCFLHPNKVTIDIAMEIIHLSKALLCSPRLTSYVVNTIVIPNLSIDSVFIMLDFTRTYPDDSVDRLESKCCEVIAENLEDIINGKNTEPGRDFQYIITTEIASTRQGGDTTVTDIPLRAEIRRAINRLVNITREDRIEKLKILNTFVDEIVQDEQVKPLHM
jgi:hypothetical protein